MLARRFAHPGHHLGDLAAHERDVARGFLVGFGGEQTHEAGLADRAPVRAVALDPHVVHVRAPVHPRAQVRLGHDQRVGPLQPARQVSRQYGRLARSPQDGALRIAQHAQAAGGGDAGLLGGVGPRGVARVLVHACAQEDEVVVRQPAQQGDVLRPLLKIAPVRGGLELGRDTVHQRAHRAVVVDRRARVREGRHDVAPQRGAAIRPHVAQSHHDDRLDHGRACIGGASARGVPVQRHHRVRQGAHVEPRLAQLSHEAVDEEGAVGLHHAQHVAALLGPEFDLRLAGRTLGGEAPGLGQQPGERVDGDVGNVLAHVGAGLADEAEGGGIRSVGAQRPEHFELEGRPGPRVQPRVIHGSTGIERPLKGPLRGHPNPRESRGPVRPSPNERRRRAGQARRRGLPPGTGGALFQRSPPEGTLAETEGQGEGTPLTRLYLV